MKFPFDIILKEFNLYFETVPKNTKMVILGSEP